MYCRQIERKKRGIRYKYLTTLKNALKKPCKSRIFKTLFFYISHASETRFEYGWANILAYQKARSKSLMARGKKRSDAWQWCYENTESRVDTLSARQIVLFCFVYNCKYYSRAKLESVFEDSGIAKAHILAPTIVELFEDFFCSSEKLFSKSSWCLDI